MRHDFSWNDTRPRDERARERLLQMARAGVLWTGEQHLKLCTPPKPKRCTEDVAWPRPGQLG